MQASDKVSQLSEMYKQVLRLVWQNYEAKEIARLLSVSPYTINERLRAVRRILDVPSSMEAARLLAAVEHTPIHNRLVNNPIGIEMMPEIDAFPPEMIGPTGSAREEVSSALLRETQAPYFAAQYVSGRSLPLPFPTREKRKNDLTAVQTLLMILVLTVTLAIAGIAAIAFVEQLVTLRLR